MNTSLREFDSLIHIPDVDAALPKLKLQLIKLQSAVLNNEDWPGLEENFKSAYGLAAQIFRREEEAMDLCRDRGAATHKAAHQKFLATLSGIERKCEVDGPSVALAMDLRSDVIGWLSDHHLIMNSMLGKVVKEMIDRSIAYHNRATFLTAEVA